MDWRLAQYLSRQGSGDANADIVCRVARAGERPILFLPSAATTLHLEEGPTPVQIDREAYEVLIAKIAIDVVRKPGEGMNLLPEILRRWFGGDVGLPGRGERVRLKRGPSGLEMEALRAPASQGPQVWGRYLREAIPPAFGLAFSQAIWNAGFVVQDPDIFLLVTLAKNDMNAEHRYVDHFVSNQELALAKFESDHASFEAWTASPQSRGAEATCPSLRATDEEDGLEAHALRLLRRG